VSFSAGAGINFRDTMLDYPVAPYGGRVFGTIPAMMCERAIRLVVPLLLLSALPPAPVRSQGNSAAQDLSAKSDPDIRIAISDSTRTLEVPALGRSLSVSPAVFRPVLSWDAPIHNYVAGQPAKSMKRVLDIGTGSGVLGLIALKHGAKEVVATDISSSAVENAARNAGELGYAAAFHARLVPAGRPGAFSVIGAGEKFDLVIMNPPFVKGEVKSIKDHIIYDPGFVLLRSFLEGLKAHLNKKGRAVITCTSDKAGPGGLGLVKKMAPEHGLKIKYLYEDDLPEFHARLYLVELTRK